MHIGFKNRGGCMRFWSGEGKHFLGFIAFSFASFLNVSKSVQRLFAYFFKTNANNFLYMNKTDMFLNLKAEK
jgi:hypothetical protein